MKISILGISTENSPQHPLVMFALILLQLCASAVVTWGTIQQSIIFRLLGIH